MSLFCLLWVPLFYLFWRSISSHASGGVLAFFLGTIFAAFQFFMGPLVNPGGFGFSRWLSGFVDIVSLPVLVPFLVCLILVSLKVISGNADFANFAFLWLIPGAVIRALFYGSQQDAIVLVLVPLLWTAIIMGVSYFITLIQYGKTLVVVLSACAVFVLPLMAASSYWAFFSQKLSWGFLFLLCAAAPMLVSLTLSFVKTGDWA